MDDMSIQEFVDSIKEPQAESEKVYSAIVSRVDDEGIVWVNLFGSQKETPTASASSEIKSGDVVDVQWRNNKLYIAGNYSDPSAGVVRVTNVEAAAKVANDVAAQAVSDAAVAKDAADSAVASAAEASSAAQTATGAASSAIAQLGYIQDVVNVLEWVQKHGEYSDSPTEDTSPSPDKFYFERSGTGTAEDPYVYEVVTVGEDDDPSALGLYELTGVDEAITNYVATHIAVTERGLFLQNGESAGTKVLLSPTDGVILYDQSGIETAKYGTVAQLGRSDGFHISIDPNTADGGEIGFYDGTTRVAYVSGNKLYIEQSVVLSEMQLGENKWSWKLDPSDDSINLTWIG